MPASGRSVLVTGAAGGMCRGITDRLGAAGYEVVCVDVDAAATEIVVARLRSAGSAARGFACDLRDESAVRELGRRVGPVDAVVNAAGILQRGGIRDLDRDAFDRTIAVNLTAAVDVIRVFLPGMLERGWGRIVNITSIAASHGYPFAAYAASKAALKHFGMALVGDLRGTGVTVNAISPGVVDTPMVGEAVRARVLERVPTGALISPDEIGEAVVFLLGDAARNVTGADLVIDGGATQLIPVLEA